MCWRIKHQTPACMRVVWLHAGGLHAGVHVPCRRQVAAPAPVTRRLSQGMSHVHSALHACAGCCDGARGSDGGTVRAQGCLGTPCSHGACSTSRQPHSSLSTCRLAVAARPAPPPLALGGSSSAAAHGAAACPRPGCTCSSGECAPPRAAAGTAQQRGSGPGGCRRGGGRRDGLGAAPGWVAATRRWGVLRCLVRDVCCTQCALPSCAPFAAQGWTWSGG